MYRLASLLYSVIGASLAGTMIVIALVSGFDTARSIIIAAAIGFAVAIPVAMIVARKIYTKTAKA